MPKEGYHQDGRATKELNELQKFSLICQLTVCASDSIFCVKTVRNVSTVFSSLATWEEVCN